jgi:hypothetical protein
MNNRAKTAQNRGFLVIVSPILEYKIFAPKIGDNLPIEKLQDTGILPGYAFFIHTYSHIC